MVKTVNILPAKQHVSMSVLAFSSVLKPHRAASTDSQFSVQWISALGIVLFFSHRYTTSVRAEEGKSNVREHTDIPP